MLKFLSNILSSVLGTILALILIIAGIGGYFYYKATDKVLMLDDHSILEINVEQYIPELSDNIETSGLAIVTSSTIGLHKMVELIESAANNNKINGLLVKGHYSMNGQATIATLREAIERFKSSGKPVWAYADYYSQSAYWLSTVADTIYLNPNGSVDLKGFGANIPFFKGMMDKIGVTMNIFYAGKFKSATEPYRRKSISPENRAQTRAFLEDMLDLQQDDITVARNLKLQELDRITRQYVGGTAKGCLESGLVDYLSYWSEVEDDIRSAIELDNNEEINYINIAKFASTITKDATNEDHKIAVLYAEGSIIYGDESRGAISNDTYLNALEEIKNDSTLKALVLRINSGGGNVLTTDNIAHAIDEVKKSGKKVVASFGDYAASGGYYLAVKSDTIVSMPSSLTGSIGVFMMFPDVHKLLNEKIGISFDSIKTHPYAVGFNPLYELTSKEEQHLQEYTDKIYVQFLNRVAEGRSMSISKVDSLAQGRVWTGIDAKEAGLVDIVGDLDDAINIASEMSQIDNFDVITYPKLKPNPLLEVLSQLNMSQVEIQQYKLSHLERKLLDSYAHIKSFMSDDKPQMKLPWKFEWN